MQGRKITFNFQLVIMLLNSPNGNKSTLVIKSYRISSCMFLVNKVLIL